MTQVLLSQNDLPTELSGTRNALNTPEQGQPGLSQLSKIGNESQVKNNIDPRVEDLTEVGRVAEGVEVDLA